MEWKQRIQEEHPKTEPQEKVETKPIAPAQIKKPESPVNTEAEPVSETPKKPEKGTSQNTAQKKNEAPQSEEPRKPEEKVLLKIANIISWNLWQMDGLTNTIPYQKAVESYGQLSLFDEEECLDVLCVIKDWKESKTVTFEELLKRKEKVDEK